MSRIVSLTLLACTLAALCAQPAAASRNQVVYFEAPRDLLNPSTRENAFATLDSLGVRALRIVLYWRNVAPASGSARRPNFDAASPFSYDLSSYDAEVAGAAARGWPVLLTVSGPVPRWATAARRDNLTRPSAHEFGLFMTAVARHYGSKIQTWSIWNEPNHPQFLLPQFVNRAPVSPRVYRGLFQAGYAGLQAAGIAQPQVLMGETAPRGTGHDVAPLTFLREALCLNLRYQRASSCSALPAAGYAHHAYTTTAGPFFRPPGPNDVTIGVLPRLVRALDAAARAGAIRRNLPIYLTEFGIQSKPNPFLGVSLTQQAEYQEISERIAYDTARVRAFSQYLLRDDATISTPSGHGSRSGFIGFQSGLRLANGRDKPSLPGFRLPLVVYRRGGRVGLWGLVRPASSVTSVEVLYSDGRSSRLHRLRSVSTNALGYWTSSSSNRSGRRWRVRWRSPDGVVFTGPPIRAY